MSLASLEKTVVTDIRDGLQNAVNWVTQITDTHLPAVVDELKRLQGSPVTQAIEAAFLTPAEEAWLAKLISEIPNLRSKPAGDAAAIDGNGDAPSEPGDQSAS